MKTKYRMICAFCAFLFSGFVPASALAAEDIAAAPQFITAGAYEFRFRETDYYNDAIVQSEYTLTFKEVRDDRLIFTRRDVRPGSNGAETEAIYTKDLSVCHSGNTAYDPCAPFFSFPMKVGNPVGGEFVGGNARRERKGTVKKFENLTLPAGTFPAYRHETFYRNKDTTESGSTVERRADETYYYCLIPPVGVMCYYEARANPYNKGLFKRRLIAVKRLTIPEAVAGGTQPIVSATDRMETSGRQ